MKLEQSFEVDAPLAQVWEALVDMERAAPCLPGAALASRNDDGSYNGTFTIKIGPTTASYTGKLEVQDVDDTAHTTKIHAEGSDRRGQGEATATVESTLSPQERGTRVDVVTDYNITGRLARFGRGGMIEDISERLLREFAGRLQSSLREEQPTIEQPRVVEEAPEPEAVPAPTEAAAPAAPAARGEAAPAAAGEAVPAPGEPPPPPEAPAPPEAPPPPPEPEAAAPPPPPPHDLGAPGESSDAPPSGGSAVLDRIRRNPAPVVAVVGGIVLIGLLRRRR